MAIDKITKGARPRVKAFFSSVEKHFEFLKSQGYDFIGERLPTGYAVKDIVEVLYLNPNLSKAIVINFQPNGINGNQVNLISVYLYKSARMINDNLLWDKQMVLSLYIEKHKPKFDISHLKYPDKNSANSFEENLNTSLSGWAYLLKDICVNLVNGSEWEDGLFYDWSSAEKILYKEQKRILGEDNEPDS